MLARKKKSKAWNHSGFDYPKHIHFECNGCALCCADSESKSRNILLLETEVNRIAQKTLKTREEFGEEIEGQSPYAHRMKKRKSGRCVFLNENDRCSIYEIRPLICRFFPFELKDLGEERYAFAYTDECSGIGKGAELELEFFESLFCESSRLMGKCGRVPAERLT
jgi:Fe-S-cluster containining protein